MAEYHIFVVSDGTGETATKMSKAALLQFKPANTTFVRHSNVRSVDMVREIVRAAEREPALVIHTFASRRLRQEMEQACQELNVASLDLIGPLIEKLAEFIETQPAETPGLLHQVDDDYFDRIDALAFTVRHGHRRLLWVSISGRKAGKWPTFRLSWGKNCRANCFRWTSLELSA